MDHIAIIGSGVVGETLANGVLAHGYAVMRASRSPDKLAAWRDAAGPNARTGTPAEAARFAGVVVLAVKGSGALAAVAECGAGALDGKVVIDTTNPIADTPPVEGVLSFFTGPNDSLMEQLQAAAPAAHFVKAFSSVGAARMVDPDFGGTQPTMFICGNDAGAKQNVRNLLDQLGWETEDLGGARSARAIEPLCILWCLPGFLHNRWSHAFKLLV
jgi:predicted dinucleotide-binding enzyme